MPSLFLRTFDRDDQVAEDFMLKAVEVGKGYDVCRRILPEAFPVEVRDPFVICKEDAEVSILQP